MTSIANPFRARGYGLRIIAIVVALTLSGCLAWRNDIAPSAHRAALTNTAATAPAPIPVEIEVAHRIFGWRFKFLEALERPMIAKALAETHTFVEADDSNRAEAGHLTVVMSQDIRAAKVMEDGTKRLASAFTLGLYSTEYDQVMRMECIYTPRGGTPISREYTHTVRTTIGWKVLKKSEHSVAQELVSAEVASNMLADFSHDYRTGAIGVQVASATEPVPTQLPATAAIPPAEGNVVK
jgi:hypothetical protein